MGQTIQQDMAISLLVVHALLNDLEVKWNSARHLGPQQKLASLGAFICIAFCGSFHGPKVFLTDMAGHIKFSDQVPDPTIQPHVIIPLLGVSRTKLGGVTTSLPLQPKQLWYQCSPLGLLPDFCPLSNTSSAGSCFL